MVVVDSVESGRPDNFIDRSKDFGLTICPLGYVLLLFLSFPLPPSCRTLLLIHGLII